MTAPLHRRAVLRHALHVLAVVPAAALLGCGSKGPDCNDVSALSPEEVKARDAQNYLEKSMDPKKACDVCALYTPPASEQACGGCTVLKGPVQPKGTCKLFAAKAG